MDYSPQGLKESDVTEAMAHEHKQGTRSRVLQLRLGAVKSISQSGKQKKQLHLWLPKVGGSKERPSPRSCRRIVALQSPQFLSSKTARELICVVLDSPVFGTLLPQP